MPTRANVNVVSSVRVPPPRRVARNVRFTVPPPSVMGGPVTDSPMLVGAASLSRMVNSAESTGIRAFRLVKVPVTMSVSSASSSVSSRTVSSRVPVAFLSPAGRVRVAELVS